MWVKLAEIVQGEDTTMKRILIFAAALLVIIPAAATTAVAAEDQPISAFFGTFSGGGVAQNRDSIYFAVTARDFDVTITPAPGNGFRINWTSVIRRGGTPGQPKIRRKASTKTLASAETPGMFRGANSGNPLDGQEMCWGYIRGNTFTVFLMRVDKGGNYELQQYDRTLTDIGMELVFRSMHNGETVRTVTGRLVRTGK